MKSKIIFYHAGCPVCVDAESNVLSLIDQDRFDVEVVHFAEQPERLDEAQSAGVRSVPALLMNGEVLHINFGASLEDLRAG